MNLLNAVFIIIFLNFYNFIFSLGLDYYFGGETYPAIYSFILDSGAMFILVIFCLNFARKDGVDLSRIVFRNLGRVKTYGWVLIGVAAVFLFYIMEYGVLNLLGIENNLPESHFADWSLAGNLDYLLLFLFTAIIVPVSEEIFLRGFVYGAFRKKSSVVRAAIYSSAIFAILHFVPQSVFSYFAFGLVAVALYEITGTLAAPIMMHIAANTMAFVAHNFFS